MPRIVGGVSFQSMERRSTSESISSSVNSLGSSHSISSEGVLERTRAPQIVIPVSKAYTYISVFEDALEQLAVLAEIAPDNQKNQNQHVRPVDGGEWI
jgi:hypothetical protein